MMRVMRKIMMVVVVVLVVKMIPICCLIEINLSKI